MRAIGITHRGFESVAGNEIKEILNIKTSKISDSVIEFSASEKDLAKLCYRTQSLSKVLLLFETFDARKDLLGEIKQAVEKIQFSGWLKNRTFRVNVMLTEKLAISSQDIAGETGAYIIKKTKAKAKMTDPDIIVLVYITKDKGYIGIDLTGFDISKRDYKIYAHSSSLNGSVAYSLLRVAGFKTDQTILDPFCGSGTIAIEAGLYSTGISPNFYRKDKFAFHKFWDLHIDKDSTTKTDSIYASDQLLSSVKATRNNAKIAGVNKFISVTKASIDWLDTKFDKNSIDLIVTKPPPATKYSDKKQIKKIYSEFFHQAKYILKSNGKIGVILPKKELFLEAARGFKIISECSVFQGKQELFVIILKN